MTAFTACVTPIPTPPIPTPEQVAKDYPKELKRITEKPKSVGRDFWVLCATQAIEEAKRFNREKFGVHGGFSVHYYRNALAMAPQGDFPAGSVLVKEKLSTHPEGGVVTVAAVAGMIKQPAGTSPQSGDWLFFMQFEGKVHTAKMESCAGCHSGAKRDFVFTDAPK